MKGTRKRVAEIIKGAIFFTASGKEKRISIYGIKKALEQPYLAEHQEKEIAHKLLQVACKDILLIFLKEYL